MHGKAINNFGETKIAYWDCLKHLNRIQTICFNLKKKELAKQVLSLE